MKVGRKGTDRGRAGYSLVEVTLALLVVAVGLTATFAVFPEAMKNTRASVDATEVGLFADYVFATLAAGAANPENSGLQEGKSVKMQGLDDWSSLVLSEKNEKMVTLETGQGNLFYWVPRDDDQGTGDWHLTENAKFWTTAFTYDLEADWLYKGQNRDTLRATLKVWPGEWKKRPNEKKNPPYVFTREILSYPEEE